MSNHKPNKIRQRQWILQNVNEIMAARNDIEMYLTHNKERSIVAERFIRA